MVKYEDMLDEVMPELPGCSNAIAVKALKDACHMFLSQSLVYQQKNDPISVEAGTAEYDLDSFTGYENIMPVAVYIDTRKIDPTTEDKLRTMHRQWDEQEGQVGAYIMVSPDIIRLVYIPEADGVLDVKVALTTSKRSTGIEDFIWDQYYEYIAAGAKRRVMRIPNKPYSQPELAKEYGMTERFGIDQARSRSLKSGTNTSLHVRMRKI
jgi:hypothetical protein